MFSVVVGREKESKPLRVKFWGGNFIDLGAVTKFKEKIIPRVFVFRVLLLVFVIGQKFMRLEEGRRKVAFVRYARNDEVRAP